SGLQFAVLDGQGFIPFPRV
uniref:CAPA-Periviscerokinin-2 n=2 Tax=Austrophasmatidae TaxID=409164 RepID=PVK2_NAMOO|nr:RecName: Full=CAPA-Periviscerokinin-2; Short=CAPA-PVK-2 [Striatophasma naukluftense]P86997.1 RecName: Full=CAPA-Periviscerokinin-2; Short=CAPA-PVK-2 [Namaquaphasma ookiepense]